MASRQQPQKQAKGGAKSGPSAKSPTKAAKRQSTRERVAAQRAAARRAERMRWIVTFSVTGVVVAALAVGTAWAVNRQDHKASNANPTSTPSASTALPPWPVPADPVAGARAVGLDVKPQEGTAVHFHTHLDILVDGKPVPVPANLGISTTEQAMSELHTHDTRGVLHIEAPTTNKHYTLGQVFSVWQVRLTPTSIGGLTADSTKTFVAYVDGKKWDGDPAAIELKSHEEIALVYGSKDAKVKVPSSYKFEQGE